MPQDKNAPLQVFRVKGVKVSVFQNSSDANVWHKITTQKIYRDADGTWKTTTSLGRDDIPVARMLMERAWEFILDLEAGSREPSEEVAVA